MLFKNGKNSSRDNGQGLVDRFRHEINDKRMSYEDLVNTLGKKLCLEQLPQTTVVSPCRRKVGNLSKLYNEIL